MTKKTGNVTVINKGLCMIYFKGEKHKPDSEFEIEAADLENAGIEMLIARGNLVVKDDSEATKEVKERVNKRIKKDPDEGKSIAELEDGGEYQ